jgi:hypothetical protein
MNGDDYQVHAALLGQSGYILSAAKHVQPVHAQSLLQGIVVDEAD